MLSASYKQDPQLTFTCSKLLIEAVRKKFEVNNKNTRTTSLTSKRPYSFVYKSSLNKSKTYKKYLRGSSFFINFKKSSGKTHSHWSWSLTSCNFEKRSDQVRYSDRVRCSDQVRYSVRVRYSGYFRRTFLNS